VGNALQAFKVNSIDYLLKPIDFEELKKAITKYKNLQIKPQNDVYNELLKQFATPYRQRFLVKIGEQYKNILIEEIAYFMYDEGIVFQ
jgi:DNA-binding LytR/AlgR family response regulator